MSESFEFRESNLLFPSYIQQVHFKLLQEGQYIDNGTIANLMYDSSDPAAVTLRIPTSPAKGQDHAGEDVIDWILSREVLTQGLKGEAGMGDVLVWNDGDKGIPPRYLFIGLRAPSGNADLSLRWADVNEFIKETEGLVPAGHEFYDLDDELRDLLSPPYWD